jgi:hypothetical protein
MSESHWWYPYHISVKSWNCTTWFRVGHFQTPAGKRFLQSISWLNSFFFFFWNNYQCFLKEEVNTSLMGHLSTLNSPTASCLYMCSLREVFTSTDYEYLIIYNTAHAVLYVNTTDVYTSRGTILEFFKTFDFSEFHPEPLNDIRYLRFPREQYWCCLWSASWS